MDYTSNVYNSVWKYKKPTFGQGYYYNAKAGDNENNRVYINYGTSGFTFNAKSKWARDFFTNNELGRLIKSLMLSNYKDKDKRGANVSFAYQKDKNGLYLKGTSMNLGNKIYIDNSGKETRNLLSIYSKNRFLQSYNNNYLPYRDKRNNLINNLKYKFNNKGELISDFNPVARYTGDSYPSLVSGTNTNFVRDIVGNDKFNKITGNDMYDAIRYQLNKDGIYNINRSLNSDDVTKILEKINNVLNQNGMGGLVVDGVLGPSTYHMMKTLLLAGYNF